MNWEALTAISSALTGVVILVTVFVGVRQLRHLQRATQLDGILRLIDDIFDPKLLEAIEFVRFKLPALLEDPDYLKELRSTHVQQDHPAYIVLRWLEKVGTLAPYDLIDPEPLFALNSPDYQQIWALLRNIVVTRSESGLRSFDNAEYLCTRAWRWTREEMGRDTYDRLAKKYGWTGPD